MGFIIQTAVWSLLVLHFQEVAKAAKALADTADPDKALTFSHFLLLRPPAKYPYII